MAQSPAPGPGLLELSIRDQSGEPLADVVAYLTPADEMSAPMPEIMDQVNLSFEPHVLPVRLGTSVDFPNSDQVRHHVYSFSPAKRFELPLYSGLPSEPVVFDRPGEVVLGCNIHDRMLAYIYVVDSPYFAKSDEQGRVLIGALPAGEYRLDLWHPRQAAESPGQTLVLPGDGRPAPLTLAVNPPPPPPEAREESSLQQRFRRFRSP
ncbi:MAG TPA: methylamine utilization protein [Thioalkalivibrio sp.]|nr:methylamine utilization protein [Thioalkalivibrio sp.]